MAVITIAACLTVRAYYLYHVLYYTWQSDRIETFDGREQVGRFAAAAVDSRIADLYAL